MPSHPLSLVLKRWKFVLLFGAILAILSGGATVFFPLEYRADAQVLIISKSRYGVDPYTVVKSAERVGENIVAVMKTDDFRDKVRAQPGYAIDWGRFDALNERARRRAWPEMVGSSVVYGTGVLNVSAYHPNPDQARALAGASVGALVSRAWEYVGGDVILKVVNTPVVTRWPVRPNLALNTVLGGVVGVILAGFAVSRRPERA